MRLNSVNHSHEYIISNSMNDFYSYGFQCSTITLQVIILDILNISIFGQFLEKN